MQFGRSLAPLLVLLLACEGDIGFGRSDDADAEPGVAAGHAGAAGRASVTGGSGGAVVAPAAMGSTPLHRLNRVELVNTVTDLFGAAAAAAIPPGEDPKVQGLDTNASVLTTTQTSIDGFLQMSDAIASAVAPASLGACATGQAERDCARVRIASLAPRVLRRPPSNDEVTSYLALWDDVRSREDADAATRAVLQRLLLTPDFLYHVEIGDAAGKLTDYEMAARLAFLAWESTPDATLLADAAAGKLHARADVEAALARLLADPRGARVFRRFFELWADVGDLSDATKDKAVYPEFEALRAPMQEEFRRFVDDLAARDGTIAELFTSTTTFANDALAKLYGATATEAGFAKLTLDPTTRAGVLTQPAFLALHGKANKSAPILRGVFIRERVLCAPVGAPPANASSMTMGVQMTTTTRAYFDALTAPAACRSCHEQLNPVGFALEGFDGVGRARTMDNGYPVDTTGAITSGDAAGPVSGAVDLAQKLGASASVRTCLATHWFRSRFRRVEGDGDAPVIDAMTAAVRAGGDRLRALATSLAGQEALYRVHFRVPLPGEAP